MTSSQQQIIINHLNYAIGPDRLLFNDLNLSLGDEKTGLVGRNGIGKSTLLGLMMGSLEPDSGSVRRLGTIAYFPQQPEEIATLSGGEITRLNLAKVFASDADFIILDEPTNNLDEAGRADLYALVTRWKKGLLIVSHDRDLLNLMDQIIELTTLGPKIYGGNYDLYHAEKNLQQSAAEHDVLVAKQALKKTRHSTQATRERIEQKASQGRKLFESGKIDKIFARAQQGRSEKTHGKQARKAKSEINTAEKKLSEAKEKLEISNKIIVNLPGTYVPNGKVILAIEKLCFAYEPAKPLFNNFDLQITGPEHVALVGPNGSGKTTLVKLILGDLQPQSGLVLPGTEHVSYLSQTSHLLNPELSLIDNFLHLNPDANLNSAHAHLAQFLFRNREALKLIKYLSGGEKLRAELACVLMSKEPQQLLILDEPTNHLDLDSIESIESALFNFQGAMLVISHDQHFLNNIGVDRYVRL